MAKPLVIDLFCGLGGWSRAFLDDGWDAIGFDIERHDYGTGGYPGQLVLQDVLTLDGHQFRDRAALIVASPPCQTYSYMAMPWTRAKALAAWYREDVTRQLSLNCLFNCAFRIAHQAGIPIVVENVRGAEPWVGGARWHYGSFYFWGDVPVLMPTISKSVLKRGVAHRSNGETNFHASAARAGTKNAEVGSGSWFNIGRPGQAEVNMNPVNGHKGFVTGLGKGHDWRQDPSGRFNSKSDSRKAASAMIAMIPYRLAQHIARVFKP